MKSYMQTKYFLLSTFVIGVSIGLGLSSIAITGNQIKTDSSPIKQDSDLSGGIDESYLNSVRMGSGEGKIEWSGGDVTLRNKPYLGSTDARFKLVTYEDFDCSFCGQYNRNGFQEIVNNQVEEGEVQYFYKHYNTQQGIGKAADQAVQCALNQENKVFWKMKKQIYENQKDLKPGNTEKQLNAYAQNLDINVQKFDNCLENNKEMESRQADQKEAENFTTQFPKGTPAMLLYDTKTGISKTLHGAINSETLQQEINSMTVKKRST